MPTERTSYAGRKRTLVTGGAGFIGSHLCERLLAGGDDVLCVDNFFTGTQAQHRAPDRRTALRADAPRRHLSALCRGRPRSYNLACPASPIHYQFDPVQTTKTSVHRRDQYARPRQARENTDSPSIDLGGLRRSELSIRSPKTIGATSIRSAHAHAMTKANAAPRLCSSITGASIISHQGHKDLQHLWPAHASERWPSRL